MESVLEPFPVFELSDGSLSLVLVFLFISWQSFVLRSNFWSNLLLNPLDVVVRLIVLVDFLGQMDFPCWWGNMGRLCLLRKAILQFLETDFKLGTNRWSNLLHFFEFIHNNLIDKWKALLHQKAIYSLRASIHYKQLNNILPNTQQSSSEALVLVKDNQKKHQHFWRLAQYQWVCLQSSRWEW